MGSFRAKYLFLELRKYIGIIFYESEERYKIWRGIDWSFQTDIGNFNNFDLSTCKSLKLSF